MSTNKKYKAKRSWMLYVFIMTLMWSVGTLSYRFVNEVEVPSEVVKGFSDMWAGKYSYDVAEGVAMDAISYNKTNPTESVQVIIDNINCDTNIECIAEQKENIKNGDYDISFEYENGCVHLVKIEKM